MSLAGTVVVEDEDGPWARKVVVVRARDQRPR